MTATLERLSPWLFTIGIFLFWEAVCRIFKVDKFILPAPSEAFAAMAQYWRPLLRHSLVTLWTTMAGFALAIVFGIILGLIVGWSRAIYRGLYPVMIGFNCIPKVAVVPILIMWFGIGEIPAILTAFLISFSDCRQRGDRARHHGTELEDVLRALGASKLDIMLKVGIPRTQPICSVRSGGDHACVCRTVVSETVSANAGLGYQIALSARLSKCRWYSRRCFCSRSRVSGCTPRSPMSRSISHAGRSALDECSCAVSGRISSR
jgi:NitT/TauT family transport system permease protein